MHWQCKVNLAFKCEFKIAPCVHFMVNISERLFSPVRIFQACFQWKQHYTAWKPQVIEVFVPESLIIKHLKLHFHLHGCQVDIMPAMDWHGSHDCLRNIMLVDASKPIPLELSMKWHSVLSFECLKTFSAIQCFFEMFISIGECTFHLSILKMVQVV